MKSPDFFKPRETHTKAQNSFYLFIYLFYFFEKSPMKTYMGECLIYIKVPLDETKAQALEKNWESKGDPKEPHTHKKNHCSTSR
jgi:hypothetical protein